MWEWEGLLRRAVQDRRLLHRKHLRGPYVPEQELSRQPVRLHTGRQWHGLWPKFHMSEWRLRLQASVRE